MIQLNPDNLVRVELTPKEQKTVLNHCQSIDRDIYDRIRNAPDGVLHLLIEDCHYLKGCIHLEMERNIIPENQTILGKVFNKLSPNPITRDIAAEIEGLDFDDIDNLNDHLQGIMTGQNTTPDPEMGGLSPEQVARLIHVPWDDDNFPLKFNKQMTIDDLKNSPFFHNARSFLNTLIQMEKKNTATVKGNLTRIVVKAIFDQLIMPESDRNSILSYNKVINELDVKALHHIRVVCESAGIIKLQKKHFIVEKDYIELLDDKNAGKLFYLLFFSYFRKFNIAYVDGMYDFDCIQDTIPYSFYRLSKIGKKQVDINKLKKLVFLPAVLEELIDEYLPILDMIDEITLLVQLRIVKPLESFGLIECYCIKKYKCYREIDKVKKTELFDKFMKFEV